LADPLAQRKGSERLSARGRYLLGLLIVALVGAVVAAVAPPGSRDEVGAGVLLALLVQAPLGWWTLRSIGTEKFQLVWVGAMIIRMVVVALAALVLARVYRWDAGALLLTLVVTLLALLLVEAVTAVREHSRLK
jgi:hypothetical protein